MALPGVVVHRVEGHATGLYGPRPWGTRCAFRHQVGQSRPFLSAMDCPASVPEWAATPVFTEVLSDDSVTDLEDELLHVSSLPMIVSPLQDSDTVLPVSPSRYPAPPVPALPDPAPTSQLSPVSLRGVNTLPTIDLFPSYTNVTGAFLLCPGNLTDHDGCV